MGFMSNNIDFNGFFVNTQHTPMVGSFIDLRPLNPVQEKQGGNGRLWSTAAASSNVLDAIYGYPLIPMVMSIHDHFNAVRFAQGDIPSPHESVGTMSLPKPAV